MTGPDAAPVSESATERMWRQHAEALEGAIKKQDAVIGLVVEYVDDIIDRAHAVNASEVVEAGAFALYAEERLLELVARVTGVAA